MPAKEAGAAARMAGWVLSKGAGRGEQTRRENRRARLTSQVDHVRARLPKVGTVKGLGDAGWCVGWARGGLGEGWHGSREAGRQVGRGGRQVSGRQREPTFFYHSY